MALFRQFLVSRVSAPSFSPQNSRHSSSNSNSNSDQSNEREIDELCKVLRSFPGGSVDLDLSELQSKRLAKLVINQPNKRNAFSGSMFCDFLDSVRKLEQSDLMKQCSAVLLLGKRGSFCSGADLNFVQPSLNTIGGGRMVQIMHHILTRFAALPYVTASLLEGFAVCGGAELAAWTDMRLAEPGAKIIFVQSRRSVTTAWGGTLKTAQLLGSRRALQVLVPGRVLTASAAQQLGFVDYVLPTDKSSQSADVSSTVAERLASDWLAEFCSHTTPQVVHAYKRLLNRFDALDMHSFLFHERREFLNLWATEEHLRKFNEQFKVKQTC